MTVAFFLTGPFPTLSETFILNQMTGLLDRGHDVHVFAARPSQPLAHPAVERYRLLERTRYWPPMPPNRVLRAVAGAGLLARRPADLGTLLRSVDVGRMASSLSLLFWTSALVPRRTYDILYCHYGWNGLYASMLRQIGAIGGKLVTAFHGADLSWQLRTNPDLYRPLFERGELFLPISEHWKRKLIELGCDPARVDVHRMGIDCERLSLIERRLEPGQPIRLLSVSRLVEKKGLEYGIAAVTALVARGHDLRYDIIGDGPLREPLASKVRELGLGDRVTLRGWQDADAVGDALRRAHLALAPSVTGMDGDQEGIPVFLMEAMATGLPVVSTRHSGIPELVEDGVSGRLVAERDVEALANAIEQLVRQPERWPAMGAAGRARVLQSFEISALNDRLVARFSTLLAGGTS
jgi:colanic acid/amylovoran biosynthesis glycosyltransferase